MNLLGEYTNGNYNVKIFDDGTKIRETEENEFISEFPENIDIKITNKCDMGCEYCHENSVPNGEHGDILQAKFIDTLQPYTELAIGGGNPLEHPDLVRFLQRLRKKKIIANITVNQYHFMDDLRFLKKLVKQKLIYGIGVSFIRYSLNKELNDALMEFPNAVLHVINGVVDVNELMKLYRQKILILGYKEFRRGKDYYSKSIEDNKRSLYVELPNIVKKFKVTSFDNLALEQLDVRRLMSQKEWDRFYMGDDGQYTMYIDMVKKRFAENSISEKRYELEENIKSMFTFVKEHSIIKEEKV